MNMFGDLLTESYDPVIFDESVILELNYNRADMEDLKTAVDAIKKIVEWYIKGTKSVDKILDEITKRLESAKNNNDILKLTNDITMKYIKAIKSYYGSYDLDMKPATAFNLLRRVSKKFNIKWSDEAMDYKKKIDKELNNYGTQIIDIGTQWCWIVSDAGKERERVPKLNKLNKALDRAYETFDEDAVRQLFANIKIIYSFLCQELGGTLNDISYVRFRIGVANEKKLRYKIINALFKTKRVTNESTTEGFVTYIQLAESFHGTIDGHVF